MKRRNFLTTLLGTSVALAGGVAAASPTDKQKVHLHFSADKDNHLRVVMQSTIWGMSHCSSYCAAFTSDKNINHLSEEAYKDEWQAAVNALSVMWAKNIEKQGKKVMAVAPTFSKSPGLRVPETRKFCFMTREEKLRDAVLYS